MTIGDVFIACNPVSDYGVFPHGCYGAIIHDLECPPTVDVRQLNGPGSYSWNEGVSPHTMSDRTRIVQALAETHSGAHVGPPGNQMLVGFEVVGYAGWTTDQWMADISNLLNQARAVANLWRSYGWSSSDLKWGSLAELKDAGNRYRNGQRPAAPRVWTHNDSSQALGGSNHWDPGTGFPFAKFMEWCHQYFDGGRGQGGAINVPTGGGVGGAQPADWFDGATLLDVAQAVR